MNRYRSICGRVSMLLRQAGGDPPVPREAQNRLDMRALERYVLPYWQDVLANDENRAQFFNVYDTMKGEIIRRDACFEIFGINVANNNNLIMSAINYNDPPSSLLRMVFNYIMAERFGVEACQQYF